MEEENPVNLLDTQEQDSPRSFTNILDLNNDCLLLIFQQLNIVDRLRLERVCKRWQALLKESWCNVKFLDFHYRRWGFKEHENFSKLSYCKLKKVLTLCGRYVTRTDINMYGEMKWPNMLSIIANYCPNIQYIKTTNVKICPANIRDLAERCSKIVEISLGQCTSNCDEELALLFRWNKKLESVLMAYNYNVNGECLSALNADNIKCLMFFYCINLSLKHLRVIKNFKNLNTLHLNNVSNDNFEAAEDISECFQNLKSLSLSYMNTFLFSSIQMAKLSNIEELAFLSNPSITDDLLMTIGKNCKLLKEFHISDSFAVTNRGLASILALSNLKVLVAESLINVNDEVFNYAPNLETLRCTKCVNMKDEGIARLIKNSHNIKDIFLFDCKDISNELIRRAIKYIKKRENGVVLRIHLKYNKVNMDEFSEIPPLLKVLINDNFHFPGFMNS